MKANVVMGVTLATLLGWGSAADAEVQRWVDEKGRVHYSNTRPVRPAPPKGSEPAKPSEPETPKAQATVERAALEPSPPPTQARPEKQGPRRGFIMILIFGGVLTAVGLIWVTVEGFKQSLLWGLLMLLFPIHGLFTILHWQEAKKPFLVSMAGLALIVIAGALMALGGATPP